MNPFAIRAEEYNIEKKDFLVTLVCLLWKGAAGNASAVERDVIAHTLGAYFSHHFSQEAPAPLSFNGFYEFALRGTSLGSKPRNALLLIPTNFVMCSRNSIRVVSMSIS